MNDTPNNNSHKTAIARRAPSAPAKWICGEGIWSHSTAIRRHWRSTLLDFGCGRSVDAEHYASVGRFDDVRRYDPYHTVGLIVDLDGFAPFEDLGDYDVVTCTYVLNVIEDDDERDSVLDSIRALLKPGGTAYIAVRADVKAAHTTQRGTWQAPIRIGRIHPGQGDVIPVYECSGFHMYELTRDDLADVYTYVAE
jgi:SAM-dependent methyltransferase